MHWRQAELRIGTLRACGEATDRPAHRLALEQVLERSELMPVGLAPDAVLVVRRIRQAIPLGPRAARDAAERDWGDAVRMRLESLYRGAARPQRGRIAPEAEAVLFRDTAELLACLALDLARGVAWQRWWWRAVLAQWPGVPAQSEPLVPVLMEEAQRLPATMATLHAWDVVAEVLRVLAVDEARGLVSGLARAFELRHIQAAAATRTRVDPAQPRPARSANEARDAPVARSVSADGQVPRGDDGYRRPPIGAERDVARPRAAPHAAGPDAMLAWASREVAALDAHLPSGLGGDHRLLLALALALSRAPWRVRAQAFQVAALAQWGWPPAPPIGSPNEFAHPVPAHGRSPAPGDVVPMPAADTGRGSSAPRASQPSNPVAEAAAEIMQGSDGGAADPSAPNDTHPIPRSPDAQRDGRPRAGRADPVSTTAARSYAGTPVTGPPEEQTAIAAPGRFGDAHALTTELGGVLYLINLMTALELPECLEADWRLASQVGPWGLLELLARGLLAETEHGYGDDPLWAALARLDGRDPTQAPGRGFVAAPAYRIPTGWREQLESAPPACAWASADGRLRLWSDAGFVLAEIPCEADAALAQVRNAMEWAGIPATRPLRRAAFADAPLAPGRWSASAALDRLLALILPCLRLRLALALGLAPDDRAALGALLGLRARVYVSSSHLDLVAPIDEVSLPARWAGLDRDPGWLPAFGRVVLFHFE